MLMHHVSWCQVAPCRRCWLRMFIFWLLCLSDLVSQIPGSQITILWPQKWRSHPSLTPMPPQIFSLYLMVTPALTMHSWVGFVLESPQLNNLEENKQQQIYIALCHTSESKGGSSQGQSWYKQDAGLGKEERHMLCFFFVLSWTFWCLHPQVPYVLYKEHTAELWVWALLDHSDHFCWWRPVKIH